MDEKKRHTFPQNTKTYILSLNLRSSSYSLKVEAIDLPMALCLRTSSRSIIHYLKSKMGLLSFSSSSLTHQHHQKPPFTAPTAQNLRDPFANFSTKVNLLSTRRFQSTKVEEQWDSLNHAHHNQVHPECKLFFFVCSFRLSFIASVAVI